jgi:hypothetical protein
MQSRYYEAGGMVVGHKAAAVIRRAFTCQVMTCSREPWIPGGSVPY